MKKETIKDKVEVWLDQNRAYIINRNSAEISRKCAEALKIRPSTAYKYVVDYEYSNKKDYFSPIINGDKKETLPKDIEEVSNIIKEDKELLTMENKDVNSENIIGIEKPEVQISPENIKVLGPTVNLPEGMVISNISGYNKIGKVVVSPNGVYQQVPRYKNENNEFVPTDNIVFRDIKDLDNFYSSIRMYLELKDNLNLRLPAKRTE